MPIASHACSAFAGWLDVSRSLIRSGFVVLGLPTEKVNAPDTGWESAETAFHATTYEPSASVGTSAAIVDLPPLWVIDPTDTAVPSPATTRIESGNASTPSLNVSVIWFGDVGNTAPAVGLLDTSSAWALAAPHVPSTPAIVASNIARRATRPRRPTLVGALARGDVGSLARGDVGSLARRRAALARRRRFAGARRRRFAGAHCASATCIAASRSARARETRERIVPTGQPITAAASS